MTRTIWWRGCARTRNRTVAWERPALRRSTFILPARPEDGTADDVRTGKLFITRIWRSGKSVPRTQPTSLGDPVASGTRQTEEGPPRKQEEPKCSRAASPADDPSQSNLQILAGLPDAGGCERRRMKPGPSSRNRIWIASINIAHGRQSESERKRAAYRLGDIDKQLDQLKAQLADLTRTTR